MLDDCQLRDPAQNPANPRPTWGFSVAQCHERAAAAHAGSESSFHPSKHHQDAAFLTVRRGNGVVQKSQSDRRPFAQTFMQEIPEEILHVILSGAVRGHDDLRNIALCSKRWRAFAMLEESWKRLCIRGWGHRADIIQVPINKEAEVSWRDYYQRRLLTHLPEFSYMKTQQQMTASIRSILINWLLAVIDEFQQDDDGGMFPGYHHQTVALFDRYCSTEQDTIQTNELQMIGAACAVLALHSNEAVANIDIGFFNKASFYTDGACSAQEVQEVAHKIINAFPGAVHPAFETACDHIDTLLTAMQKNYTSSSTFCLAHYLGELALQAEVSLKYSPKCVGAAAYALACHTLGWPETLWMPIIRAQNRELTLRALEGCIGDLQALLVQALGMLTKRNKKVALPHVIVKYCRRERQHVGKVIVTASPWPLTCPHGCTRTAESVITTCQECDLLDEAPHEHEHEHARQAPDMDPAPGIAEHSLNEEHDEEHAAMPHGGGAHSTPRDLSAEREATRTPANLNGMGGSGELSALREGDGEACGGDRYLVGDGGERGLGQGGSSGGGLQDVSFGAISDACDNSMLAAAEALFDFCDDGNRRASMGDRRASLGSVLGAVHEEEDMAATAGGCVLTGIEHSDSAHVVWEPAEEAGDVELEEVENGLSDISIDFDRDELSGTSQLVC